MRSFRLKAWNFATNAQQAILVVSTLLGSWLGMQAAQSQGTSWRLFSRAVESPRSTEFIPFRLFSAHATDLAIQRNESRSTTEDPVRLRISQCCQERLNDNRSPRATSRYDQNRGSSSRTESLQARSTATMGAGPASRHWRRYLRFSLRGLIVVVLVIGVGLGWIIRQGANSARSGGGHSERRWGSSFMTGNGAYGNAIPVGKPSGTAGSWTSLESTSVTSPLSGSMSPRRRPMQRSRRSGVSPSSSN